MKLILSSAIIAFSLTTGVMTAGEPAKKVSLLSDKICLQWKSSKHGWVLNELSAYGKSLEIANYQHCVLYSSEKPPDSPLDPNEYGSSKKFPEEQYRYVIPSWNEATTSVALNRAGEGIFFLPDKAHRIDSNTIGFDHSSDKFSISEIWKIENNRIDVVLTLTAKKDGWYSIATPSVLQADDKNIDFAIIPGMLHGHGLGKNFSHDYAYGWDIPSEPVIFRERSTSTLTSILTTKSGVTFAVTAKPGTAAEPWGYDKRNHKEWRLGLSAMNRAKELSPTLYHPVLGQADSYMKAGEERCFSFIYTIDNNNWWESYNRIVNNIFKFDESLKLRKNRQSLTDRLYKIHKYVTNDSTSKWHTIQCEDLKIGAQEYLGGVYKAKKDAMKNADYGAMWMLGAMTADSLITDKRLPYARNFKIKQHVGDSGSMTGASKGQYYLRDSQIFVEEWGPYIEPIATTYYMLMDIGNILLFNPDDDELRSNLKNAADFLLRCQNEDGSWAVAYDNETGNEEFKDLRDYRPTFYGLVIAYRMLGDKAYLDAARRGADWLIKNAVDTHRWLGVCGDTRFAADFATAQAAQAFIELYELCNRKEYLDASIKTARFYTTSIYTNPVASEREVKVNGRKAQQWEITTSGLSYEHGGIIGSCNLHGPILLASHAGMFIRMYSRTGDKLFLDMARAAAIGRDAFVDNETGVASYYWAAMNRGAGPYPHHAWWQMGWITDYLVAEMELRSNGNIKFPAGFITPKVGPHRTFGFRTGTIDGDKARLVMKPGAFECNNPNVEVLLAEGDEYLYMMLMNDICHEQEVSIKVNPDLLGANAEEAYTSMLSPYGIETIKIPLK